MKKITVNLGIMLLGCMMLFSCNYFKTKNIPSENGNDIEATENDSIEAKQTSTEETFKVIDQKKINELNKEIASKNFKSDEEVMSIYRPKSLDTEGDYQYNITKKTNAFGEIELTLIETGLMDDSQAGQKVIMVLKKEKGSYSIVSMKENYSCWKDRGHENWGAELFR